MDDKEFQKLVLDQFQKINEHFQKIDDQLAEIKEDTEITRESVNSLIEWSEAVGERIDIRFPMKN